VLFRSNLFKKVGITHITCTGCRAGVELFEHGEKHHANHQPNGYFRKPLVIQAGLQSQKLQNEFVF
jgi:hypothetical protein